ncbi:TetR/AcrR family transcriptional regulator [Acinetobacter qingfengensis]|uniref:TetR family transcriptional regulator n=1 Tax=Acinetobacter qingfengensis TaxID=1262585 RepID=A0A1E7RCN8_9GAMM|nr:TetR/AcrR family transcriptional regulator [Acinetobacter qingfengensis]KAA8732090.1 TetR/AcrR family transcriptional regulator [Acinetobacter qingfengensis]OEY97170.1 TetR family transcriptional regulator [Acinetobacter qingfengensis]
MTKAKRGRPKCFDEQKALEQAMLLFWQYGYEATSISDLTQALGITAPSLYCTFGDKTQLFYRCLEYYLAHEACSFTVIFQQAKTAKIAIEIYLHENIKHFNVAHKPKGCMFITAAINCPVENQDIQNTVQHYRLNTRTQMLKRLQQGITEGDLPHDAPIQLMVDFYCTLLQGLTLQARDGAETQQLQAVVDQAIKHWDIFLQ